MGGKWHENGRTDESDTCSTSWVTVLLVVPLVAVLRGENCNTVVAESSSAKYNP